MKAAATAGDPLTMADRIVHSARGATGWDLRAWAWTENSDGVLANFNHPVGCPAGTAKLYQPSDEP